jgi:hypothetical protein
MVATYGRHRCRTIAGLDRGAEDEGVRTLTLAVCAVLLLAGCGSAAEAPGSGTPTPAPASSTSSAPGAGVEVVTVRGTVSDGVEAGCLLLTPDGGGDRPLLLLGNTEGLKAGDTVEVRGAPLADVMTSCQQGDPFDVQSVARP